jgi:hypothetical protein
MLKSQIGCYSALQLAYKQSSAAVPVQMGNLTRVDGESKTIKNKSNKHIVSQYINKVLGI